MEDDGLRRRGAHHHERPEVDDDDHESSSLLRHAPSRGSHAEHDKEEESICTSTISEGVRSLSRITNQIKDIRVEDVYRYWSIFQNWLYEVPTMARSWSTYIPVGSISSFNFLKPPELTPEQEQLLAEFVEKNVGISYTHESHFHLLTKLWELSFPNATEKPEQHDPMWKRMGFQGNDPATDFRAAGMLPVLCLTFFAEAYPDKYMELLKRSNGKSAEESYPFACAAINVVYMLTDIMKLKSTTGNSASLQEAASMRANFVKMLEKNEKAFMELFCVVFLFLDSEWVRTNATYMQFPIVLKTTREKTCAALRSSGAKSPVSVADIMGIELFDE
mmetsp:Transcript_17748/g.58399  ORF Transcript_17748/g.58399 Transcript_17748/m.58399 type:complete len:333 (-) Transcript_17748:198-1196(-)